MRGFFVVSALVIASVLMFILATNEFHGVLPLNNQSGAKSPIKHVIIIMQENHAFDNYFGAYPGADGLPSNTCIPYDPTNLSKGCVRPWATTNNSQPDVSHAWINSNLSYDYGKMDGFVFASGGSAIPMSHYDNRTIPNYWAYANQYVLTNRLFSSALSYSLPNHWYTIAARAPNDSFYYFNRTTPQLVKNQYLNQANETPTVGTMLDKARISWKYYDAPFQTNFSLSVISGSVFAHWNPFAAKSSSYASNEISHFAAREDLFLDIQNGTLPQVSWVVPNYALSEHPPSNVSIGMWYVTDIVDSIMQSKYWNSTAIIVTWDDFGGYYDHVTPPQIDRYGLSFRVPGLIISPYAKKGYVDNTVYSFVSTLAFIEWNFGLGHLTNRDTYANNMLNAFNFSQKPRTPYIIPISQTNLNEVKRLLQYYRYEVFLPAVSKIYVNGFLLNASDFDT